MWMEPSSLILQAMIKFCLKEVENKRYNTNVCSIIISDVWRGYDSLCNKQKVIQDGVDLIVTADIEFEIWNIEVAYVSRCPCVTITTARNTKRCKCGTCPPYGCKYPNPALADVASSSTNDVAKTNNFDTIFRSLMKLVLLNHCWLFSFTLEQLSIHGYSSCYE